MLIWFPDDKATNNAWINLSESGRNLYDTFNWIELEQHYLLSKHN